MKVKTEIINGDTSYELKEKLEYFLNKVGYENILHIDYSIHISMHSKYSTLVIYKSPLD